MGLEDYSKRIHVIKSKLYRFALKFLHDKHEAEDVVQETLAKVWSHKNRFDELANFEGWCMTLFRTQSLDRLKSAQYKTSVVRINPEAESHSKTPYQQAELADRIRTVRRLIDTLPEKQKEVIHLRDVEGFSYQEIADIMEIEVNLVKVTLFRARTTIKTKLLKAEAYGTG